MNQQKPSSLPEGGKARRVYLLLRDEISNGSLQVGTLLPGEQRMAETYGVSRVTIRRALEGLAMDGLIQKKTGAGSIVLGRAAQDGPMSGDITSLMPQVVDMGRETTARLLSFSYDRAPMAVSRALALDPATRVQAATRVRLIGDRPFSYLVTYVPEEIARNYTEADLATTPLFKLLERSNVQVSGAHQTVTATLASPEVAEALDVSVGSALLSIRRVVRDQDGRGVEYLSALYRPDMFRLDMDLDRVGRGSDRHWEPVIGPDSAEAAE